MSAIVCVTTLSHCCLASPPRIKCALQQGLEDIKDYGHIPSCPGNSNSLLIGRKIDLLLMALDGINYQQSTTNYIIDYVKRKLCRNNNIYNQINVSCDSISSDLLN